MNNFPIIAFLFLFPVVSFVIILFTTNDKSVDEKQLILNVRYTGIWTFFLVVLICLLILFSFDFTSYLFQFVESSFFIFGYSYNFGIDGISLIFLLLNSCLLLAMSFLVRFDDFYECKKNYVVLFIIQIASLILLSSLNLLFFILFFDITSILIYLLLSSDCKEVSISETWKIASSFAISSSVIFVVFYYIFMQIGTVNIDELILYDFSFNEKIVFCLSIFLSFLIRFGIIPFGRSWVYFCTSRISSFVYLITINCLVYSIFRISLILFDDLIYLSIDYLAFFLLFFAILNNLVIQSENIYKIIFSHVPIIVLSIFLGKDGIIGAIFYLIGYNIIYICLSVFMATDNKNCSDLDNYKFWHNSLFMILISMASGFLLSSYLVGYLIILQSLFELSGIMFALGMILWVLIFSDIAFMYPKIIKKQCSYLELLVLSIMVLFVILIGVFPNIITDFLGYSFFID